MLNKWKHPGGKLREPGAEKVGENELLLKFGSMEGMANQPLEKLYDIKP